MTKNKQEKEIAIECPEIIARIQKDESFLCFLENSIYEVLNIKASFHVENGSLELSIHADESTKIDNLQEITNKVEHALETAERRLQKGKLVAVKENFKDWLKHNKGNPTTQFSQASNADHLDHYEHDFTPRLSGQERKLVKRIELPDIKPFTENQSDYLKAAANSDITFCLAPAGTGKTFLAVYVALQKLKAGEVHRIILTRPAVTTEEDHGALPGELNEKMAPYMKPLYKALMKLLANGDLTKGKDLLRSLMKYDIIEISPLSHMRGEEFDYAFVIGDEFQNATVGQFKMFTSRLGENGYMVIGGDPDQVDLPPSPVDQPLKQSGLAPFANTYKEGNIDGISIVHMDNEDAKARHRLLPIINAMNNEITENLLNPSQDQRMERGLKKYT